MRWAAAFLQVLSPLGEVGRGPHQPAQMSPSGALPPSKPSRPTPTTTDPEMQETLDLLDDIIGDKKEPAMFTPEWWAGGYGEAILAAAEADRRRWERGNVTYKHNGWPKATTRKVNYDAYYAAYRKFQEATGYDPDE